MSHLAVAFGDGVVPVRLEEVGLQSFRTPVEKERKKISHGNRITPPL